MKAVSDCASTVSTDVVIAVSFAAEHQQVLRKATQSGYDATFSS
jgi:hypothetical protein